MNSLQSRLREAQEQALSEGAWAAFDAATLVLNEFRERVKANSLKFVNDPYTPHYEFSVQDIEPPKGSTVCVSDWIRHKDYVLGVIRESTGMSVEYCSFGGFIELRQKTHALSEPARPTLLQWLIGSRLG